MTVKHWQVAASGRWQFQTGQFESDLHRDFEKVAFRAGGASRQVALAAGQTVVILDILLIAALRRVRHLWLPT